MHSYGVRDVEKLLRLPRSTIRALVAAGFVSPGRGPGRTLRFSFQDLIVLRTAQALAQARVPAQRITRSLKALRRQLPESMPLSGLAIGAVGTRVVVRDGAARRLVESGQYLLSFEGDPEAGALSVIERAPPAAAPQDEDEFARALALEESDPAEAIAAYRRALEQEPARMEACVNLGRLLQDSGRLDEAEAVYRGALARGGTHALLHYNLGVLLEDRGRKAEALAAYEAALRYDGALADAHYNLALLCEQLRRPQEAIRHMARYRRLAGHAGS
jgi:tetratricopeptide (TPR) repeat protein